MGIGAGAGISAGAIGAEIDAGAIGAEIGAGCGRMGKGIVTGGGVLTVGVGARVASVVGVDACGVGAIEEVGGDKGVGEVGAGVIDSDGLGVDCDAAG